MISRLEGILVHKTDKFLVIDVSGVGYKVFVTPEIISNTALGDHYSFWIFTAVRENSIDLYGFKNTNELSFFELLLDVSGVGPKSALAITAISSIENLKRAIASGDTSYLNKVSGIGKKTAEKIVIELRDKLKDFKGEEGTEEQIRQDEDVLEALKSLGYSQNEARDALKQIPQEILGTNAKIKDALRILGGRN